MSNWLNSFGYWLIKRANYLLFIWLVLIIYSLVTLIFFPTQNPYTNLEGANDTEAGKVQDILEKEFFLKTSNFLVLVSQDKPLASELKSTLIGKFAQITQVIELKSKVNPEKNLFCLHFNSQVSTIEQQNLVKKLRAYLKELSPKIGTTYLTGNCAFYYDMVAAGKKETTTFEIAALLLTFLILLRIFGGLVAALLPIFMGISTLLFLNVLIGLLGTPISYLSQILNTLIGLALSIDYALFIVSRFKEEFYSEYLLENALNKTLQTAGRTIFFSALVICCSLLPLYIPDVSVIRVIVSYLLLVVLLACFNNFVFLPVLLVFLREYLERPVLLAKILRVKDNYLKWRSFAIHVVKFYPYYLVMSALLVLILSFPLYKIKLWEPLHSIAPKHSDSMKGYNSLQKDGWSEFLLPIQMIVKISSSNPPGQLIKENYELTKFIKQLPGVQSVQSLTPNPQKYSLEYYQFVYQSVKQLQMIMPYPNPQMMTSRFQLISVNVKDIMNINRTHLVIKSIRNYIQNQKMEHVLVGGVAARARDFTLELYRSMPLMVALLSLALFIILTMYTSSIVLSLKAIFMNFLPIFCSFGILVLIYQEGYFQSVLNTPLPGAITNLVPIILFCIVFGLGMDYEILILARILEVYHSKADTAYAVTEGLARSGSVITGAALILLGVFIPGIFSQSAALQEICLGITLAILLDATVVRLFLVPSLILIMGRWNWWMPFKKFN